jgi:hypothetical protein
LETIRTGDPNLVGELLRAQTFTEHDPSNGPFGCYTTFVVRDDATPWAPEQLEAFYAAYTDESPDASGYTFRLDDLIVDCCWFWDGDGVLCYAVWRGSELVRAIENWDCKKNYVWQTEQQQDAWSKRPLEAAFTTASGITPNGYFSVESGRLGKTPARYKRCPTEAEARLLAAAELTGGEDSVRVLFVAASGAESVILELLNPALRQQAKAGPRSRPSALAGD